MSLFRPSLDWIFANGLGCIITAAGVAITINYFRLKKKKQDYYKFESSFTEFKSSSDLQLRAPVQSSNVSFYRNEIPSEPDGDYIENILTYWYGNYHKLETNHYYIQWLFPNRKPGINTKASILTDEDVEIISSTPVLRARVKRAFGMMLNFYGMRLTKDNQFELGENSAERLEELNEWGNHNFLYISRILLALKELGHKDLMLPWLMFLADLIYKEQVLNCAKSCFENYWMDTLDAENKIQMETYLEEIPN